MCIRMSCMCSSACPACARRHALHVLLNLLFCSCMRCVSGSVCLFVCPLVSVCLSVCINLPLFYCPSVCLSVSHSICVIVRLSVCLSVCQSFYLCACLFVSICRFSFSSIFMVSICVFLSHFSCLHIFPVHLPSFSTFSPLPSNGFPRRNYKTKE